jgi:cytochrome b subunit of formate dehydrogenase
MLFAGAVVLILVLLTVGIVISASNGGDIKGYFSVITSIVTSIISALVGYLAGKSQGGPPPPPAA